MIRRPPRSTRKESSAASDVYKRQGDREPVDIGCLLYTSPSPRDGLLSRMPSSAWKKSLEWQVWRLLLWASAITCNQSFLMIRRPPRSTRKESSAASDVYKRQGDPRFRHVKKGTKNLVYLWAKKEYRNLTQCYEAVSYTHLRAHETDSYLVCRLLLEKTRVCL